MFLDEIGDVDLQVQPKLLKVLEEKSFRRLGEVRDRHVDVRLIAATHHDLGALIREKTFRSDLYFRISTIPLTVPPLRERVEDIPVLARHFLSALPGAAERGGVTLSAEAEKIFCRYPWPGNLRELRNVIERALPLRRGNFADRAGPPVRRVAPGVVRRRRSPAQPPGGRGPAHPPGARRREGPRGKGRRAPRSPEELALREDPPGHGIVVSKV